MALTSELSGIRRPYGEAPLERWVMPSVTTEKDMSKSYLNMVDAVNEAKTERDHAHAEARLSGWIECADYFGLNWSGIAADRHTETKYGDRPMCCGVLLDWTPTPKFANVFCSQCGQEFGPGDHGFSHCANHKRHNVKSTAPLLHNLPD